VLRGRKDGESRPRRGPAFGGTRVVEPGGAVHLVCAYEYADGETLFAREVETYLPGEKAHLTTRFRVLEGNVPIAPSLFAP
jgi:hypothetical protein